MYRLIPLILLWLIACQRQPGLKEALQNQALQDQLMGMSVVLIEDDTIKLAESVGWMDAQEQIPLQPETKFRIASISKTITTIAILQLVERDSVDLDLDVSTYLGWILRNPNFPQHPITLRLLLSHQSSIRDGSGYGDYLSHMHIKQLNINQLFVPDSAYFSSDMFAQEMPGSSFSYSNSAWGLVASIVERRSGQTFDAYCRQHIFKPMGLSASYNVRHIADSMLSPLFRYKDGGWVPQVDDYSQSEKPQLMYSTYQPGTNGLIFAPQGGVRASALDLAALAIMLMNDGTYQGQQILKPQSAKMMMSPQWQYNGQNGDTWNDFFRSYGLGTHILTNSDSADYIFPEYQMMGHAGIAYGLLSDMYFDPIAKTGIVFITNGSKNEFEYAKSSSFYQVEQNVFQICHLYLKDR